jgi:hypothetical protein
MKKGTILFVGYGAWCLFVIGLMILFFATMPGCSDDTDRNPVDTGPCEAACDDIGYCFGWEGLAHTESDCLESCDESTANENECIYDCEHLLDCVTWFDCISGC